MSYTHHKDLTGNDLHRPFKIGDDGDKPSSPKTGDWYFATDADKLYRCATEGEWESLIDDSATGPTDLWSAQKIESEIATISGAVDDHNELKNIQGGAPDDYYHLTNAQHTDLTDSSDCSIHKHDNIYYTETELNNGQLDNRYYTETEVDTISGSLSAEIDSDIVTFSGTIDHDTIQNTHNLTTDVDHNQLANYEVGEHFTEASISHLNIQGIGSTTHSGIDAHIVDDTKHRLINDSGSGVTDLWSAQKITTLSGNLQTNIDGKSNTGHTHTESDITDLDYPTTLSGLSDTPSAYDNGKYLRSTVSGTEWSEVSGGISDIVEDTTPQLGGDLDLNGNNVDYGTVLTVSGTYEGEIMTVTVDDASTAFGNGLYCAADFHYERADADAASTMPCRCLALEVGNGSKKVLLRGQICNTTWDWSAGDIYVDTISGTLTQTHPTGEGDQIQIVGWALSANVMFFETKIDAQYEV